MSIKNWYVEERRAPAPRQRILAVPEMGGEAAWDARNSWQCQSWVAETRPAPRDPGSARNGWRSRVGCQKSLAVPTLAGEMRPWDGRAHGYCRAYHLSSFTSVLHCTIADLDHRPTGFFEDAESGVRNATSRYASPNYVGDWVYKISCQKASEEERAGS